MRPQPDNLPDKLSGLWLPLEGSARVATVIPTKCRDTRGALQKEASPAKMAGFLGRIKEVCALFTILGVSLI
ncbi:MAG: hypothetical protein AAB433_07435 [Nitrospirota bacterium]